MVVPLVALKIDLLATLNRMGINSQEYHSGVIINESVKVLVCVIDIAFRHDTIQFLQKSVLNGKLSSIVIEEVHLTVNHKSFRQVMTNIKFIGSVGARIILVSGTMFRIHEKILAPFLGFNELSWIFFRSKIEYINRRIFNLRVQNGNKQALFGDMKDLLDSFSRTSHSGNILIFSLTRELNQALAVFLLESNYQVVRVDATSSNQEREAFIEKMNYGESVIGCSTSVTSEGVDFKNLFTVICCGGLFGGISSLHQVMLTI